MPTYAADCPFCAIVAGEDKTVREVYRDADTVAFFPTEPATLGHLLVIPRTHVADIWGIDLRTATDLLKVALSLASAVRAALEPDGLNVIQSNGLVATQTVDHLHVHLVPRWENDAFGPIWPTETTFTDEAKDETLAAIQNVLQSDGAGR